MLPKQDRNLIMIAGRYTYYKMKDLGLPLTIETYNKYLDEQAKEKRLKKKMGYREFNKMKELGLNYEEYKQYKKEQKLKKYEKKREKDRIRFRTIRYIERYCDLDMKCQICDTEKDVQIHHPNYNEYLKINLLCKKHHDQLHMFELIPPKVIDLTEIKIKNPPKEEREKYIQSQIENIKADILINDLSYKKLKEKYGLEGQTIKRHLIKQNNYEELVKKLEKNGKLQQSIKYNPKNPLQSYKQKYKLTSREIADITGIALPTIRKIECGMTDINKIRPLTKQKLGKILTLNK